jgi:hypothetical protein
MSSFMSLCEGVMPFADFGHTDRILFYPQMQAAIAWSLVAGLIAAALGIVQQRQLRDPPVVHPPRRGAGGVSGRVPPRSAAGSTLRRI